MNPAIRRAQVPRTVVLAAVAAGLAAWALVALPLDRALVAMPFVVVLVVVAAIDIERGIIPNRIVLPAAAVLLAAQLALFPSRAPEWILAPITVAVLLSVPQVFNRAWMGMGDVKLTLLIGVGLGWDVFGALIIAFLCVFPVALFVLLRGGMAARNKTIPFGPFLSIGAVIVMFGPALGV